jgi:DNA-binding MarR family transcriptional regulator
MKDIPDLEAHLGYWLRFVSNHVSGAFRDRCVALGVTVAEWVALRSLHQRAPCGLGELAGQMGIDAGATSRLVERLIRKKLALRRPAPTDRRAVTLELSAAGRKLVGQLAHQADLNDATFFEALPAQQRAELLRILKSLVKAHGLTEKPTA